MALTDNLQAFYKLSDTSDSSGNGNTLTNNGDVSFVSGKIGNAAALGPDQTLSANLGLPEGPKSYSLWFNRNSSNDGGGYPTFNYVVMGFYNDSPSALGLTITDNGRIFESESEQTYNDDVWHHVCAVYDGSASKAYVDGELFTFPLINGDPMDRFVVKEEYGFARGEVSVDSLGFWNRALSDAEVAELYNSGFGGEVVDGIWTPVPPPPYTVRISGNAKLQGKVKFA